MTKQMFLFAFFSLISCDDDLTVEKLAFPPTDGTLVPLLLMVLSLVALLGFFGYHLRRIMKDITSVSPVFDIAETETKMDFTIAERGTSNWFICSKNQQKKF